MTTGTVLADRYELGEPVGSGGSADVWRAHDRVLGRRVAVKIVRDPDAGQRLEREARAAARINVPHVVGVYDAGEHEGLGYLVMELVDGVDLGALVARHGALPEELAVEVVAQIAAGLAALHHDGLVHRDVNPNNVLVTPQGTVKLVDLGLAHARDGDHERVTQTGTVVGTVDYLAPEQLEGVAVGPATDVYAAGLVLVATASGRPPFGTGSLRERAARRIEGTPNGIEELGDEVAAVARAATASAPSARMPDAGALARALASVLPEERRPLRARLGRLVAGTAAVSDDPAGSGDGATDATTVVPALAAGTGPPTDGTAVLPVATATDTPDTPDEPVAAATQDAGPATDGDDDTRVPWGPVTAAVAAVLLLVFALSSLGGGGGGGGEGPDRDAGGDAGLLAVAAVTDHDPLGGGDEHPEDVALVVDGDATTSWDTEGYDTPDLGGLKDGVGLLLDLGEVRDVRRVTIELGLDGVDLAVAVAQERPTGDPTADGTVLGTATDAAGTVEVTGDAVAGRWVAVWFTRLADDGARHRAQVQEITVAG